ncbi:hypothetical protein Tco_0146233 [Tanacetum coccineum]
MTYTVLNMFNIVDVSKLNMNVGHSNGTKALVTHVGSLKLTDKILIHNVLLVPNHQVSLLSMHSLSKDNNSENKDYELELENLNGLNFFNSDLEDNLSKDPYDDGRDSRSDIARDEEGHPDDNIPEEATCDNLENAIPDDNNSES